MACESHYVDKCYEELKQFIDELPTKKGSLIAVLHKAQDIFGFLSEEVQSFVAKEMNIKPAEVYGVATFYSFVNTAKKGKNIIRVCQSMSCDMADKDYLVRILEKETSTKMGSTGEDGLFTLEYTNCLGLCDRGPAMMINDDSYAGLTPEQVVAVLDKYRGKS